MKKKYKLIKGQTLEFDFESKKEYTPSYYSYEQCSQIIHIDGETVTPLEGEVVSFKDGLIKVYAGMDLIARVKVAEE